MKPILACDVDPAKLRFPVVALPKIDGVRALNPNGKLVGRSGKSYKNKMNTEFYSRDEFIGFDGEMVVDRITGDGICNETTSALTTINGSVKTRWCLFDYIVEGDSDFDGYITRYFKLCDKVQALYERQPYLKDWLWVVPHRMIRDQDELDAYEVECVTAGYEGVIVRHPDGLYKYGRSTPTRGEFLRLKQFLEEEIVISRVVEGTTNTNELKHNPNGYAERSTHKANMVPNGMVGTIIGEAVKDVTYAGRTIIRKGDEIEVAPGKLSHDERRKYLQNPEQIIGRIGKYQFFPVGVKDKPRFPTFQCFRDPVDM